MKTLKNTDQDAAKKNVPDMVTFGGDQFKLLSKASSESEGWMKSTKAMEIVGVGCVVQVTTQQKNDPVNYGNGVMGGGDSYSIAEAVCMVEGVKIRTLVDRGGKALSRELVKI